MWPNLTTSECYLIKEKVQTGKRDRIPVRDLLTKKGKRGNWRLMNKIIKIDEHNRIKRQTSQRVAFKFSELVLPKQLSFCVHQCRYDFG